VKAGLHASGPIGKAKSEGSDSGYGDPSTFILRAQHEQDNPEENPSLLKLLEKSWKFMTLVWSVATLYKCC